MKRTHDFPIQISDWARYVAKDINGFWCEFENRPVENGCYWYTLKGKVGDLFTDSDKSNWKESLFEVTK